MVVVVVVEVLGVLFGLLEVNIVLLLRTVDPAIPVTDTKVSEPILDGGGLALRSQSALISFSRRLNAVESRESCGTKEEVC